MLVSINTVDMYEAMCRWSRGCRFEDLHDYFVHLASDMERLQTCVINRMVPERGKFPDFQGSDATGPDFSEKRQFAAKPV